MITSLPFPSARKYRASVLFALLLFGGGISLGFSQPFVDGYVVTNQGDTIQGEIKDVFEFTYADSVLFRKSKTSERTVYFPDELAGFYIGGKYRIHYVSKTVEEVVSGATTTRKRLLKVLVLGSINLYLQSTGPNEFHFYLEKPESGDRLILLEVAEVSYEDEKTGHVQSKKFNRYQEVLSAVLADCPPFSEIISKTKFKEKDMSGLIHGYNLCSGEEPYSQNLYGKQGVIHRNGILLTTSIILGEQEAERFRQPLFEYGLYHQFVFPRISKKWYLETRLTHTYFSIKEAQGVYSAHFMPFSLLAGSRNSLGKAHYYFQGGLVLLSILDKNTRQINNTEVLVGRDYGLFLLATAGAGIDFSLANQHQIKCEIMFFPFFPRITVGYGF